MASPAAQTPAAIEPRTVEYRRVADRGLSAYVFAPPVARKAPAAPVVLLLHGGGWSAGEPGWVFAAARRFAAAGLVAIPLEYRLASSSATPIDALADVCVGLRWVRAEAASLGVDTTRVAIYGVSAGGHLAAATATIGCQAAGGPSAIRGPDALVMLSPALDVARDAYFERLLQGRGTAADYSPVEHGRAHLPPTIIVHGERDSLTPLHGSQRFCSLVVAAGTRCELQVYPGLGHLLTRNLANQEGEFDPDPAARSDGQAKQLEFLLQLWGRR